MTHCIPAQGDTYLAWGFVHLNDRMTLAAPVKPGEVATFSRVISPGNPETGGRYFEYSAQMTTNGTVWGPARNGQVSHVDNDHLDRREYATNGNQQTVWKAYSYAYGCSVTQDDIGGLNIGFPGQYHDVETGLWYNGFRDYDAGIAPYVQSDPIGLVAGMDAYAYAGGNPISRNDPLGLTQFDIDSAYANAKKKNPGINFGKGAPSLSATKRKHGRSENSR